MTARTSSRTRSLGLPALGLALLLSGCSGGGGGGGGAFYIESCTLGCGNGVGGNQVSCEIVNVGRNLEISLLFSEPVDAGSLNNSTVQIINSTTSQVPPFNYSIDPNNPRRLIARPNLAFDSLGNPVFALGPDETFEVTIPGLSQGDLGPFVRSAGGRPNLSRLKCTIRTTEGIVDAVPGAPTVSVFVDTLAANNVPAQNAFNVKLSSTVRMVFNDIMNPATLANPSTNQATFVTAKIDTDGNIATTNDQVPIDGSYVWSIDFALLRTTLTFTPAVGFPSRGSNPAAPRRIVMDLPANVTDLVGNGLGNPGKVVFTPEFVPFSPVTLPDDDGESFVNTDNENTSESGASWGAASLGGVAGRLSAGRTGGSGRLGSLVVDNGQTVVLDTDSQEFPLPGQTWGLLDNSLEGDYDPLDPSTWPRITVTDGAFEFTSLVIQSGGRLVLTGSNPGRVYSRGDLVVNGVLDVSGETPVPHQSNDWKGLNSNVIFGGAGGAGGPSAGSGGKGGDRYDTAGFDTGGTSGFPNATTGTTGNIAFPGNPPDNPGIDNRGADGSGVGGAFSTGGLGGAFYPPNMPRTNLINSATPANIGDLAFVVLTIGTTNECRVPMVGGPGSGGAYALDGGSAAPASPHATAQSATGQPLLPSAPAPTPGGDNSSIALEAPGQAIRRALNYEQNNLLGGSGGGGGGMHIWGTRTAATSNCFSSSIFPFWDHSAAGGGGGGGAVQVSSGRSIVVNGVIDASGGAGGSATNLNAPISFCAQPGTTNAHTVEPQISNCGSFAAPGGGGSGGAVKLKARTIVTSALGGRINVRGGVGGVGVGGSVGGAGSPGLVRLEYRERPIGTANPGSSTDATLYAPSIAPFLPLDPTFNNPFESAAILSLGGMPIQRARPDSFTASMSCWMKPAGSFFQLTFDDDGAGTTPAEMAWNMDVVYLTPSNQQVLFPYRGIPDPEPTDFPLVGQSFEEFFGNDLNHGLPDNVGSLVSVRFQGARSTGLLPDPCNVSLSGVTSEIAPGSLTHWVRHPAELNAFAPQPNMIRFTVVFEDSLRVPQINPIESRVLGVTNLKVRVTPD